MAKSITVYTSNTCAYCGMVKKYLQMKGMDYSEVNIEENPEKQKDLIDLSGQTRVPVTVVTDDSGSQAVTVGYNLNKLASDIA